MTVPLRVLRGDTSYEVSNFQGVMARKIIPSIHNFSSSTVWRRTE